MADFVFELQEVTPLDSWIMFEGGMHLPANGDSWRAYEEFETRPTPVNKTTTARSGIVQTWREK